MAVAGALVWAHVAGGRGPDWWPAVATGPPGGAGDAVEVALLGTGAPPLPSPATFAASQLKPFVEAFELLARQSRSAAFVSAVKLAVLEARGSWCSQLWCPCFGSSALELDSRVEVGVCTARVFVQRLRGAARELSGVGMLGEVILDVWSDAFRRFRRIAIRSVDVEGEICGVEAAVVNRPEVDSEANVKKERSITEILESTVRNRGSHRSGSQDSAAAPPVGKRKKGILLKSVSRISWGRIQDEAAAEADGGSCEEGDKDANVVLPRKRKKAKRAATEAVDKESVLMNEAHNAVDCREVVDNGKETSSLGKQNIAEMSKQAEERLLMSSNGKQPESMLKKCNAAPRNEFESQVGEHANDKSRKRKETDTVCTADAIELERSSRRRELKVSKYLLPPYTDMSGYGMRSSSFKGVSVQVDGNGDSHQDASAETAVAQDASVESAVAQEDYIVPVEMIYHNFLQLAANHSELRSSRWTGIVTSFFHKYKNYSYAKVPSMTDIQVNDDDLQNVVNEAFAEYFSQPSVAMEEIQLSTLTAKEDEMGSGSQRPEEIQVPTLAAEAEEMAGSSQQVRRSTRKRTPRALENDFCYGHLSRRKEVSSDEKSQTQTSKDDAGSKNPKSPLLDSCSSQIVEVSKVTLEHGNDERKNDNDHRALFLAFLQGVLLPTKQELISKFSKFGTVIASETDLSPDDRTACVLFERAGDAENARNRLDDLGLGIDNCKLSSCPKKPTSSLLLEPAAGSIQRCLLSDIKGGLEGMITKMKGYLAEHEDTGTANQQGMADIMNDMEGALLKVNNLMTED